MTRAIIVAALLLGSATTPLLVADTAFAKELAPGPPTAAAIRARPAHRVRAGDCRPQHLDRGQIIGAVLGQPWFVGRPPPMYINGCRIQVDPHGQYVPSEYQYNPATGNSELQ
jgi:hypothetical protein